MKVTDQPGEVAIGEKQFDDTMTQSARGPPSYTAQVRELVLLLASLSMSVRKIAVAVEAFCGLLRDGDETVSKTPSRSTICRIIAEGGVFAKMVAVRRLAALGCHLVLAHDATRSRGKEVLTVLAYGAKDGEGKNEAIPLGVARLVRKTAAAQAEKIVEIVTECQARAESIPETEAAAGSMELACFSGTQSDNAPVNSCIHKALEAQRTELVEEKVSALRREAGVVTDAELDDLRCFCQLSCILHKLDLVETHVLLCLNRQRSDIATTTMSSSLTTSAAAFSATSATTAATIASASAPSSFSMKAPSGEKREDSAVHVLFELGKVLGHNSKKESSHGEEFAGFLSSHHPTLQLRIPRVEGHRFLIYGQCALRVFPHIGVIAEFLQRLQASGLVSWSISFLLRAFENATLLGELRLLTLFGHAFGEPVMCSYDEFNVAETALLVKACNDAFVGWLSQPPRAAEQLHGIWEHVLQHCKTEQKRNQLRELRDRADVQVTPVFQHWTQTDTTKWQAAITAAKNELEKIAHEYFPDGALSSPPPPVADAVANNIRAESFFASWKVDDTHRNHFGMNSLAARKLYAWNCTGEGAPLSVTQLSPSSLQTLRRIVAQQPTQKELDQGHSADQQHVRSEQVDQQQEKHKRKRAREERQQRALEGLEVEREEKRIRLMTQTQLVEQLRLRRRAAVSEGKSQHSVPLGGKKGEQMERLLQLARLDTEHQCTISQGNKGSLPSEGHDARDAPACEERRKE